MLWIRLFKTKSDSYRKKSSKSSPSENWGNFVSNFVVTSTVRVRSGSACMTTFLRYDWMKRSLNEYKEKENNDFYSLMKCYTKTVVSTWETM